METVMSIALLVLVLVWIGVGVCTIGLTILYGKMVKPMLKMFKIYDRLLKEQFDFEDEEL